MTRQRYKQRKYRKNYRKNPESRKIIENAADTNIDGIQCVEAINTAEGSAKWTRHKIPPNKGKVPEPGEIAKLAKITRKM
jgi:hypothetical protein